MVFYLTVTEKPIHLVCLDAPCASIFPFVVCRVVSVPSSNLGRPRAAVCLQTLERRPGRGSRRMLWELAPEDVIGKPAKLNCAKIEREWKRRKNKMKQVSRWSWTANESSPRALQLTEDTLKGFWKIFVDHRPFGAEALFKNVNVQCKAVFSFAMTIMDKIHGWEDEEKRVGSKFATCMWIYTEKALT